MKKLVKLFLDLNINARTISYYELLLLMLFRSNWFGFVTAFKYRFSSPKMFVDLMKRQKPFGAQLFASCLEVASFEIV